MADTETYYDLLGPFPDGMNGGVASLLLPKTQLAFALNATCRGGFVKDRPPYQIRGFDFGGDQALQTAVEDGFFQGCGVYRPDFGPSQIVAQISGRLFTFTDNGVAFVVAEITIPGDPNDATIPQVWMWQSEKWLIISDGSGALPIFYDGVSCRRSLGPEQLLGTAVAFAPVAPPAIGGSVTVTLAAPYTGLFNITVRFNGAFYQTSGSIVGNITLTNINAVPAAVVASGSDVIVNPQMIGNTTVPATASVGAHGAVACVIPAFCSTTYPMTIVLTLNAVGSLAVGNTITVPTSGGDKVYTVTGISGNDVTATRSQSTSVSPVGSFTVPPPPAPDVVAAGALIQFSSSMGPNVILGQLTAAFNNPAVGASSPASLSVPYSGPPNQLVTINGFVYVINTVPPIGGMSLILINLTDTTAPNYTNPSPIYSISELPACRMGAYGLGQNWVCLTDGISFMVSDLVGSSSGTVANSYRDAVLKTSDADIMGAFRIPNSGYIINSMTFSSVLDTSLGQGALIIGTMVNMFTCKAPFTLQDFQATLVQPMPNPILTESLIGFGPLGQNSTVLANSDILFRSIVGLASLKLARRDISDEWGNAPISREMSQIIDPDNESPLLSYSSAVVHSNRHRMTCSPNIASQGVYHEGEIALNFDLISSLRGKAPPVYDGLWTGLNVLQHTSGLFSNRERSFAMTLNLGTNKIELYELLTESAQYKDNGTTSIKWVFETPPIFNEDVKPLTEVVRLIDGEIYIADLKETAHVKVQYRPIFYPCWIDWTEFDVCADMTPTDAQPQVRYRLGLGEPDPKDCDSINNQPFREAVAFQLRFEITGHCVWWGGKFAAVAVPQAKFAKPACNA